FYPSTTSACSPCTEEQRPLTSLTSQQRNGIFGPPRMAPNGWSPNFPGPLITQPGPPTTVPSRSTHKLPNFVFQSAIPTVKRPSSLRPWISSSAPSSTRHLFPKPTTTPPSVQRCLGGATRQLPVCARLLPRTPPGSSAPTATVTWTRSAPSCRRLAARCGR